LSGMLTKNVCNDNFNIQMGTNLVQKMGLRTHQAVILTQDPLGRSD
jgi:hypothetical protein